MYNDSTTGKMGSELSGPVAEALSAQYTLQAKLGEGATAVVHRALRKADGQGCAIKIIDKNKLTANQLKEVKEEIKIMEIVDHPRCIKMYEVIETPSMLILVLELVEGGDLVQNFNDASDGMVYSEQDTAVIVARLADALAYLHDKGITHRDVKPENVLSVARDDKTDVRLIDFGSAALQEDKEGKLTEFLGTPNYVAPEILNKEPYGHEVDVWSLGVLSYFLMSAETPFASVSTRATYKKIQSGKFGFPKVMWTHRSREAKDFIKCCLTPDPERRITAREIASHPWIKKHTGQTKVWDEKDIPLTSRSPFFSLLSQREKIAFAELKAQVAESTETSGRIGETYYGGDLDTDLIRFLMVAKFDLHKATSRRKKFYAMWRGNMLDQLEEEKYIGFGESFLAIGGKDTQGRQIISPDMSRLRPSMTDPRIVNRGLLWLFDVLLQDPVVLREGVQLVPRVKDLGWQNINSDFFKNVLTTLQEVVPVRIAGITLVEPPFLIKAALNMVWPFLSAKMKARLRTVPDLNSLPVFLPKEAVQKRLSPLEFCLESCSPLPAEVKTRLRMQHWGLLSKEAQTRLAQQEEKEASSQGEKATGHAQDSGSNRGSPSKEHKEHKKQTSTHIKLVESSPTKTEKNPEAAQAAGSTTPE
eukprot:g6553.t1